VDRIYRRVRGGRQRHGRSHQLAQLGEVGVGRLLRAAREPEQARSGGRCLGGRQRYCRLRPGAARTRP
jgi:hypothetical protein